MDRCKITNSRAGQALSSAREALKNLNQSLADLEKCARLIKGRKGNIIVTGVGKTGFIGQKIAATLTSLGQRSWFLHPVEAFHGDSGILSAGDVLLALSFSGESREVVKIANYIKKHFQITVIAFTRDRHSTLGRIADHCVEIVVDQEGSPNNLAPMASTTAMLVLGDMLAAALMNKNFKRENFAEFHPGGALGLRVKKVKDFMIQGAQIPKVGVDSDFLTAVKEINDKKLGVTAVIGNGGKIVGVITDGDVRRFLLKNNKIDSTLTRHVMTTHPKYIQVDDSLLFALTTMENQRITNIFVVDAKQRLVGIIHIHTIVEETI